MSKNKKKSPIHDLSQRIEDYINKNTSETRRCRMGDYSKLRHGDTEFYFCVSVSLH